MTLGPISTIPNVTTMATTDEIPFGFDMTGALTGISGGSVSAVSCVLKDLGTNQVISLQDAPSVAGNVVTQIVRGSALGLGHNYRLSVIFTAAANTVLTVALEISCDA